MKLLLKFIFIAAALWAGYWFVGSRGSKAGFEAWFEQQRNSGWTADYTDFAVKGFPNRFDAGFSGLSLADPRSGLAWFAPYFQILALSYKPNHVIAVWPDNQTITTRRDTYQIASDDIRASLKVQANTQLGLQSAVLTASQLVVTPTVQQIEPTSIDALTLAVELVPDTKATYRLGLSTDGLVPAASLVALIDPDLTLPAMLTALGADISVRFSAPWDRSVADKPLPQPELVEISMIRVEWGGMSLQLIGEVEISPSGLPTGAITLKVQNWRDIIALAISSGAITQDQAVLLGNGLSEAAQAQDDPKTVEITFGFRQGQIYLGPIPLGPTPVLQLR